MLKKLLEVSPTVLQLFRDDRVWEVMFSEYFFYFGLGDYSKRITKKSEGSSTAVEGITSKGPEADAYKIGDEESDDDTIPQIPESVDTEPLRLEVISFVELAATVNGTSNNWVPFHNF